MQTGKLVVGALRRRLRRVKSCAPSTTPSGWSPSPAIAVADKLRGIGRPQYRLRVDEVRVFYDVSNSTVEILAIVKKSEAATWLARFGNPA